MALPPAEAETKLLASIATPQDLTMLTQEGLTPEAFTVYGEVYDYYHQFSREYGSIPEPGDVKAVYDQLELDLSEKGELLYYAHEVLDHHLAVQAHSAVANRFGANSTKLVENPQEVVRLLEEDLRRMRPVNHRNAAIIDRDAMQRLDWLSQKAQMSTTGGVLGIPTGLACFDSMMQGWEPGEAVMVMAPKGIGKTWLALYFATVAYGAGYKALFLTPEMSWEEIALRFDVLHGYKVGVQLTHEALTTGKQDSQVYEDWLRELSMHERFIVVDSPGPGGFNVSNILGLLDQYRPDIMVLDGIQLVSGVANQPQWERIKQAADSMKAAAQYLKCTIIWTSQVDRESMRNPTEPAATGAAAAYGKAAVEAANRLITLAHYEGDDRRRTFKVPNNRSGREYHARQHLLFDVDTGAIRQLSQDEHVQATENEAF